MTASGVTVDEAKSLICELCALFYKQGWVSGTGGGISIRATGSPSQEIVMAPSGVQKERMQPEDMFVLDSQGAVLETPITRPAPYKPPKLSECSPLFMSAYELRGAGAVLHSHSINTAMATVLWGENETEFKVTQLEMIKGIAGHGFYDTCVVPIIENTARECELTDRLRKAMRDYPKSNAVLVRRHGVYVWGDTWISAKTQAEVYEYLFEAAVKLKAMGVDVRSAPKLGGHVPNGCEQHEESHATKKAKTGRRRPKCVVLDIEGTTTPITFVTQTLFPYAKSKFSQFLRENFDQPAVQKVLQDIYNQSTLDQRSPDFSSLPQVQPLDMPRDDVTASATAWCQACMEVDRKVAPLKTLQGLIWRQGYAAGELRGDVYEDVVQCLKMWYGSGIKVYIYSSGSRQAQRDLFANTAYGDLTPCLSGYFDTTIGQKRVTDSYQNIQLSLGVVPEDIVFATDIAAEADAAKGAGWGVCLLARPGNGDLGPVKHTVLQTLEGLVE